MICRKGLAGFLLSALALGLLLQFAPPRMPAVYAGEPPKKTSTPVDEGTTKGFKPRPLEEAPSDKQPFLQTVDEVVTWLVKLHRTWFFLGLFILSSVILTGFKAYFSRYMPKPQFKGTIISRIGAFLVSVSGLSVAGLGAAVLLGQRIPNFDVGSHREALIMMGAGLAVFVLGVFAGRGSIIAAALVMLLLLFDLGRTIWLLGREATAELFNKTRLAGEGALVIVLIIMMLSIRRRWKRIMDSQSARSSV